MSIQRVVAGFVLCTAATAMLAVRADQPVNLGVQMGLWEVTAQGQTNGAIPPELQQQLQSMPAEQRQKIMAAMQSAMADAQRAHVYRECMTPERLASGFGDEDRSSQCKSSLVRNTRSDFEFNRVCSTQDGSSHTEKAVFHTTDGRHISGTVDVVVSHNGHPMKIHEDLDGKWLSSNCGSVKAAERVK